MFRFKCNNQGFTLVEAVIAVFITAVAVMSIFSLMAPAWRTTSRSDYTGRAANILHDQMQRLEAQIMNPCNDVAEGSTGPFAVYAGGGSSLKESGDAQYMVTTNIIKDGTANAWRITVKVTWAGHSEAGISETLVVTKQDDYGFPVDSAGRCM